MAAHQRVMQVATRIPRSLRELRVGYTVLTSEMDFVLVLLVHGQKKKRCVVPPDRELGFPQEKDACTSEFLGIPAGIPTVACF